jgi:hypothetical protein
LEEGVSKEYAEKGNRCALKDRSLRERELRGPHKAVIPE